MDPIRKDGFSRRFDLNSPEDIHALFLEIINAEYDFLNTNFLNGVIDVFIPNQHKMRDFSQILQCKEFWQRLILQNDIGFVYYCCRDEIGRNNPIDIATFIKYSHLGGESTAYSDVNYGMDYLLDKGYLKLVVDQDRILLQPTSPLRSNIDLDIDSTRKMYTSAVDTIQKYMGVTDYNCTFYNFEFYEYFLHKKTLLNRLLYNITHNDKSNSKTTRLTPRSFQSYYLSYFELIRDIKCSPFDTINFEQDYYCSLLKTNITSSVLSCTKPTDFKHFSLSDTLYLRSQIERWLHIERTDCLFQNIMNTINFFPYTNIVDRIDVLASCVLFPSLPGFNHLLTALFDSLNYYSFDFNLYSKIYYKFLDEFIGRYKQFTNSMVSYFLPALGSHFYASLSNYIKQEIHNDNQNIILVRLYELIRQYINQSNTETMYTNISIHDWLQKKKLIPTRSIESLNQDQIKKDIELLQLINLTSEYNPAMSIYTETINSLKSEESNRKAFLSRMESLSFADIAIEPFNYLKIPRENRPQKRNLNIYLECICKVNECIKKLHSS